MTLVLASDAGSTLTKIVESVPEIRSKHKFALIWTASKTGPDRPAWTDSCAQQLEAFGPKRHFIDLEGMSPAAVQEQLADCDVIYVQGGNTFFLMKWIRESGFDKIVKTKLANENAIYIGSSAGSVVMGPSIEVAGWLNGDSNDVGLTDLTGMCLIDDMISPHYRDDEKADMDNLTRRSKHPVRVLKDDEFLLIKDGVVRHVSNSVSA